MAKLCILCCFSYRNLDKHLSLAVDSETGLEERLIENLRNNQNLREFCKDIKISLEELLDSLKNGWNDVWLCGECLEGVGKAVEVRRRMEEVEDEVRRLQRELLEKMGELKGVVNKWREQLRGVEGIVRDSDVKALQGRKRRRGKEEGGVIEFRRRIGEVVTEVSAFCGDLAVKTGELEVKRVKEPEAPEGRPKRKRKARFEVQELEDFSEDEQLTQAVLRTLKEEEAETRPPGDEQLEELQANLEELEEYEQDNDQEVWEETSSYSDEEELKVRKAGSGKKKAKKKKKNSSTLKSPEKTTSFNFPGRKTDPLKSLDTSSWSPFKLRLIARILKRNGGNFTPATTGPQPTTNPNTAIRGTISYLQDSDTVLFNSTPVIIKDDTSDDPSNTGYLECSACSYPVKPSRDPSNPTEVYGEYAMVRTLMVHINGRHSDAYRCPLCYRSFFTPKRYKDHLKSHQNRNIFDCPTCSKPCSTKDALRTHQWLHLNAEEKEQALKAGARNPRGYLEKQRNNPEPTHVCSTCGKGFRTGVHLRQHEDTHKAVRETVVCPLCGKLMLKHSYKVYHRKHCSAQAIEQTKMHCLVCNTGFKTRQFLNRHMKRVHSQEALERNWVCELCCKRFKDRGDLLVHQKIHGGEERWTCAKGCGKEFNVKRYWRRHEQNCKGLSAKEEAEGDNG